MAANAAVVSRHTAIVLFPWIVIPCFTRSAIFIKTATANGIMLAQSSLETATFGAGCFWGVEELFRQIKGVKQTRVGYTGGTVKNPTYEQVCSGQTGHIESIEIEYDPKETTYGKLLGIFWMAHVPLQANGQGNDIGSQYRAVIFYHTPEQKRLAEKSREKLNKEKYGNRIATAIESAKPFYPAEEYHQKYLQKRGGIGYCHINVKGILNKLKG